MKYIITGIILIFSLNLIMGQKPKFKKVTKEELLKNASTIDSTAKAEVLYKGCDVSFEFNEQKSRFDVVYIYQQRIKIFDSDYTDIANFSIRYYNGGKNSDREKLSDLEAYTFNFVDGKVRKEKVSKQNIYEEEYDMYYDVKKFAFPAIKDGSVLELKYTLRSQFFFNIDAFYMQDDVPIKYAELVMESPEYFNYNVNAKGVLPIDVSSADGYGNYKYSYTVDNSTRYNTKKERIYEQVNFAKTTKTYIATDVPAIKNEPYVYSMDSYRSSIGHELLYTNFPRSSIKYYTKTWDDIAEMLDENNYFGGQLKSNYKQYDDLLDQIADMEPAKKMESIYNTIRDQYTWNNYLSATTKEGIDNLIENGTGNIAEINLLLVNILQKAGLNASPMVSRSRSSGFLNVTNPTYSQLNYVMAVVESDGSYIFLDATDKSLTINTLPSRALNLKGIIVKEKKGLAIEVNNPNSGKENRIYTVFIEDQLLKGEYQQTIKGFDALETRSRYVSQADFVSSLNSEQKSFSNAEIENYTNKDEVIKIKSDVTAKGFVQNIDDKIFVDVQICDDEFVNPFKADNRNFALFYDNTFSNVDMIKIKIPEGYKLESVPDDLNIATPEKLIAIRVNFVEMGGEVVMTKKVKLSQTIISPEYYSAVKMLYDQIEAKMKEKIVLTKI